jgi:heat shock protein HtpX
VFAFIFAIALNMGAWWFSDSLALRFSHARPVTPEEQPALHRMIEDLAARANLPKPRVYLIDSETPNAFATGRSPAKGVVAVTSGIMHTLNREELAGVIAHELAHIKHRDTLIASIAAVIAGAIGMLADMAMWAMIFGGMSGSDEEDDGGLAGAAGGLLMIILAPIIALIIQLAISRSREFSADEGGARILGNPLPLANALGKLEEAAGRAPMQVNPATSHLYIVNPLRGGGIGSLFRTHPDTAQRIERLRALTL